MLSAKHRLRPDDVYNGMSFEAVQVTVSPLVSVRSSAWHFADTGLRCHARPEAPTLATGGPARSLLTLQMFRHVSFQQSTQKLEQPLGDVSRRSRVICAWRHSQAVSLITLAHYSRCLAG